VVAPSLALPQKGREQHHQLKKLLETKLEKSSKYKKTIHEFVVAPSLALPQKGREQHHQLKKLLETKLEKSSKYKKNNS
jgi:hypothetical protein